MPLFEYRCKSCGHAFEALVFGGRKPVCPRCDSDDLEKQFSTFATSGASDRALPCGASPAPSCASGGG
jgi:putative FmdB family regulatory protein